MLDLQTEYWKTLKAPYASANEFVPIHIGALSTSKGAEFTDTLMDLSDCIMHQNSFYPITVAAVPHLVCLLDERSDSPEESAQLLSVLGNAVACEAESILIAAASATDFPIVEWYHASLVRGASLIVSCIDRHAAVWNWQQRVEAALCSTAFHCSRRVVMVLILLYSANNMDECEVDQCPHCDKYMLVNLADNDRIVPREFTGSETHTGAYIHALLMKMGEDNIRQKIERLWGTITCEHCGEQFDLWDSLLYC